MSDEARAWAKRIVGVRIAAKSVLNALAGYADAEGVAWPKVSTIAQVTGMTERHVRRQLATLEAQGLIEREERFRQRAGGNTSNHYRLAVPPAELIGDRPDTCVTPRPDTVVIPLSGPGGQSGQSVRTSLDKKDSDESLARAREPAELVEAVSAAGLAGELMAVPPEIRSKAVAEPSLGEGWAMSWLDYCGFNPATGEIHPRSTYARGRIYNDVGARRLRDWGVRLGAALPMLARAPPPGGG